MITIVIDRVPTPWKAPQIGRGHAYAPHAKEKEYIQWQVKAQWNQAPLAGAVWADFTFHMPIPKNTSKTRRIQMLNGIIHPTCRPDRTNILKLYEDCLNGIVIEDDSQIVDGCVRKIYGETPKTVIRIMQKSIETLGHIPKS